MVGGRTEVTKIGAQLSSPNNQERRKRSNAECKWPRMWVNGKSINVWGGGGQQGIGESWNGRRGEEKPLEKAVRTSDESEP